MRNAIPMDDFTYDVLIRLSDMVILAFDSTTDARPPAGARRSRRRRARVRVGSLMFGPRRTAPRVRDGRVQKKNRHALTTSAGWTLVRESPAPGHRHVVSARNVRDYLSLIPEWDTLAHGLERIRLSAGGDPWEGRYQTFRNRPTAEIELAAWERELWFEVSASFAEEHRPILDLLEVPREPVRDPEEPDSEAWVEVRFTRETARDYTILHVLPHEIGHHVDRMTSRTQRGCPRDEPFAEGFANELCARTHQAWFDHIHRGG